MRLVPTRSLLWILSLALGLALFFPVLAGATDGDEEEDESTEVEVDGNTVRVDGTTVQVDGNTVQVDGTTVQVDGNTVQVDGRSASAQASTPRSEQCTAGGALYLRLRGGGVRGHLHRGCELHGLVCGRELPAELPGGCELHLHLRRGRVRPHDRHRRRDARYLRRGWLPLEYRTGRRTEPAAGIVLRGGEGVLDARSRQRSMLEHVTAKGRTLGGRGRRGRREPGRSVL